MNTRQTLSLFVALVPAVALAQDGDALAGTKKVVSADVAPPASDVPVAVPLPTVSHYANCDGSKVHPAITINDLVCFFNQVALGSAYANCDGSTGTPLITANDFVCFLNSFNEALAIQATIGAPAIH